MNAFQHIIGKSVENIFRIDSGEDFPELSIPFAYFVLLEDDAGLLINFNFHTETIGLSYTTCSDLQEIYGIKYREANLNMLDAADDLNKLIGQKIEDVKVGQFASNKLSGDNFVIKSGEYVGVILAFNKNKITFFSTNGGGRILFDSERLFTSKQDWVLI